MRTKEGLTNSSLEVSADLKRTNITHPYELLRRFGDGGMDHSGNRRNQCRFCRRGQVQGGTHFLCKHSFRRFYRLDGTVSRGLHGVAALGGRFMDYPNHRLELASLRKDVRALCRGRDGKRALSEHSANANTPSGPASGGDANPSRMRGQPARWAVPC